MKIKHPHLTVRQRVLVCVGVCAACGVSYFFFHIELGFKGFEIAIGPLLERALFAEA